MIADRVMLRSYKYLHVFRVLTTVLYGYVFRESYVLSKITNRDAHVEGCETRDGRSSVLGAVGVRSSGSTHGNDIIRGRARDFQKTGAGAAAAPWR